VNKEAIDPDGNVIREGMMIVCHRETWVVSHIDHFRKPFGLWITADRVREDGRKCRLIVGGKRLRFIQVIGFQAPRVTYP
jgi:hypothetical protein